MQVRHNQKLPDSLEVEPVMREFVKFRMEQCGNRLEGLGINDFILNTGAIDWTRFGGYTVEVEDGIITEVTHRETGKSIDVSGKNLFASAYSITDNFEDFGAYLHSTGMPKVKLSAFFTQGVVGLDARER